MYSRVYVEITNICNMRCSFCHGHSRQHKRMDQQEFAHILEQLQGKTQYIYYHLMGEPLTHPELPVFLRMAKAAGFRSVITTNGTLLHKWGTALLDAGLHKVSISLHSFEEGGLQGHLDYLEQVAQFIRMAQNSETIVSLRLWNKGVDNGTNAVTEQFLRKAFSAAWEENSRGYRIQDRVFLEWGDRFAWPDRQAQQMDERIACYGLRDHFGILCDGTVVPCCLDSDGVINLGNVFRKPLEEILSSDRAKAIAHGFSCRRAVEDLCRRCGYAQRFR